MKNKHKKAGDMPRIKIVDYECTEDEVFHDHLNPRNDTLTYKVEGTVSCDGHEASFVFSYFSGRDNGGGGYKIDEYFAKERGKTAGRKFQMSSMMP